MTVAAGVTSTRVCCVLVEGLRDLAASDDIAVVSERVTSCDRPAVPLLRDGGGG